MSAKANRSWKWILGGAVGAVVLADLVLIFVVFQSAKTGPESMRAERSRLQIKAKLLKADSERARSIRVHLPEVGKQCDDFYQTGFLAASTGYSDVLADLGDIATKAGLQNSQIKFKQKDISGRGVTEIGITADVEGDYPAIIQFIKGLEQSKNFYLMDGLSLTSAEGAGLIKLNLALRTFFRS